MLQTILIKAKALIIFITNNATIPENPHFLIKVYKINTFIPEPFSPGTNNITNNNLQPFSLSPGTNNFTNNNNKLILKTFYLVKSRL